MNNKNEHLIYTYLIYTYLSTPWVMGDEFYYDFQKVNPCHNCKCPMDPAYTWKVGDMYVCNSCYNWIYKDKSKEEWVNKVIQNNKDQKWQLFFIDPKGYKTFIKEVDNKDIADIRQGHYKLQIHKIHQVDD